jgi:hypothetical protein
LTLPYTVNRSTYAMAPYFVWQSPRPEPAYRHASMRKFYSENELSDYQKVHAGFLPQVLVKAAGGLQFFAGIALLPGIVMLRRVLMDRRTRFLVICVAVLIAGMLLQIFFIPHYVAAFTAAFYALGLQAMRHLRQTRFEGRPVGLGLIRMMVTLCVVMAGMRLLAGPLQLSTPEWPASNWSGAWYGPGAFGASRAQVESSLEALPGKQLAIVRYSSAHYPLDEWVYNGPDIEGSKVIWAREMNGQDDLELIRQYQGRQVWLVQPDTHPAEVTPYQVPEETATISRSSKQRASR